MYFTTTAGTMPYTPPALEKDPRGISFKLAIATPEDANNLGMALYRLNVVPPTQQSFRANFVEEIFRLYPEDKAEELVAQFDQVWTGDDSHAEAMEMWREAEQQRLFDIQRGALGLSMAPVPVNPTSVRLRARHQILSEEIHRNSQLLRDMTVAMNDHQRLSDEMAMRLIIQGWGGLDTTFSTLDSIVEEHAFIGMRNEIGRTAYKELKKFIADMFEVSKVEEKNSDLPPASASPPSGSPQPNGDQENNSGNLTGSDSTQTPAEGSAPTTAASSPSISG